MVTVWLNNTKFERIALIEGFESLIWTERYNEAGDFELYIPASAENLQNFKIGYYITREDTNTVMIIEKIEITTDVEMGNHIIVSGRSFESVIDRRVVWNQISYTGRPASIITSLLNSNFGSKASNERRINGFGVFTRTDSDFTTEDSIRMQFTGDNVYEAIVDICQTWGYGFAFGKDLRFVLYKGKDRSVNQTKLNHVVFSPLYDNLLNSEYRQDMTEQRTIVRIAGEGEGSKRVYASYGTGATGINRKELFVDARDLQSEQRNGSKLSASEYQEQLISRAKAAYADNRGKTEFEGDIDYEATFKYKEDYFLGDIITVENEYKIAMDCRIIEVSENWDDKGYKVVPTYVLYER